MRPSVIYDVLADLDPDRILESQSVDTRPFDTGVFLTVSFEEQTLVRGIRRGPQIMTIAAHQSWNETRDYTLINVVLNEVQRRLEAVENEIGDDGVRVSCIIPEARGRNTVDEGWQTITRTATYRVLHNG